MLVKKTDVLQFIPQRPPIVMVDGLLTNDKLECESFFQLTKKNIFCSDGYFSEIGLVENIAQTAALKAGFEAWQKNEKVKVGFIGAVKNLKVFRLPMDDQKLKTTITVKHNFGNITIIKGEIRSENDLLAEAELSIFTAEES